MSVARAAHSVVGRRWWCVASTPSPATRVGRRHFHSSAPRPKRRSRFRNVKAEEMGLLDPANLARYRQEKFPEYTAEEWEELKKKYTPEQLVAIEAGERAVDPDDMILQGRLRDDLFRPDYMEDFSVLDPRYDIKPEIEMTPQEPQWLDSDEYIDRYSVKMAKLLEKKTSDQIKRALVRALRKVKQSKGSELIDLTEDELKDFEEDPELLSKYVARDDDDGGASRAGGGGGGGGGSASLTTAQVMALNEAVDAELAKEMERVATQKDAGELEPTNMELIEDGPAGAMRVHSAKMPELGKVPGVVGNYKAISDPEDKGKDDTGDYQETKRRTGMSLTEILSLYRRVLAVRLVSNQTRLGKVQSVSVTAIAGNGNGWLGIGMAKSTDWDTATTTAEMMAIRNMKAIRRYEKRTIYGSAKAKVGATVVELYARPPGFGLRCPSRIFEMCRAAGLHDLTARMPRANNAMNAIKATYQALMAQPDPEAIAMGRGKKLVDVRKVYYGGAVY